MSSGQSLRLFPNTYSNDDKIDGVKEFDSNPYVPEKGKVIVDGVNIAKKHQKPVSQTNTGGIIDKEMPIPASNVAIVCNSCGKPTRIGYRFEADGTKVRICRKCEG